MPFKILFVTATEAEAVSLKRAMAESYVSSGHLTGNIELSLLVAGIGSVATSWNMKQWLTVNGRPDLVINAGIAGSYRDNIITGDVVMPLTDCFADAGIEDGDDFKTLAEAGLVDGSEFPFKDGVVNADPVYTNLLKGIIRPVRAITVNTATGSERTVKRLIKKYDPDIETMEGATFFYICAREGLPFLAVRAISNRVEPRNRKNWDISLALENLSGKLDEILLIFNKE